MNSTDTENQTPKNNSFFNSASHSKTFKWLAIILAELILLLASFALGLRVGFHKAHFTELWASNYPGNFGPSSGKRFFAAPPPGGKFLNSYAIDGNILTKTGDNLLLKDETGNEKTVLISSSTLIRQNFQTLQSGDLKAGQEVLIIGEPNQQGQIQAKLIRVLNP